MRSGGSEPEHYVSRPEIDEKLFGLIDNGESLIHIAGEPGVGKTWALEKVNRAYSGSQDVEIASIGGHLDVEDFFGIIYRSILTQLPEDKKEDGWRLTGLGGSAVGFGASASWDAESAEAPQVQFRYRDILEEAAEIYPADQRLLLCIDDLHKLNISEDAIRDAMREAADLLTQNITLITAGQLAVNRLDTAVTISTFSEEQTKSLLQDEFNHLSEDDAAEIHQELHGHPLYIGLLIEANEPDEVPEIPKGEVYDEIQTRYLHSLSEDEQRFLRLTSPLPELNERLCAAVIPVDDSFSSVGIDRLLRGLSDRVITRDLGWNDDSTKSYRIHDTFREFLHQRLDPMKETQVRRSTFRYYSKRIRSLLTTNEVDINTEVELIFSCLDYLTKDIETEEHQELRQLIKSGFGQDGLSYYPASLLAEELKTWAPEELPDDTVDANISLLHQREELARAFYDENTHPSWGEELLQRGRFNEPDGYLLGYLNQIVDDQPDFVLRVIQSATTANPHARRFFANIATDLPPEIAAVTTPTVADWIRITEGGHAFEYQGLQLLEYLSENGRIDAALDILESILHPKQRDAEEERRQERRFERYSTIETLDDTFDQFAAEAGEDFVRILEDTLRETLQSEKDETGTVHYESVAYRKPIRALDYDETNTGERKHIIYTYLSRAATEWVDGDLTDAARKQLFQDYLDDENPAFRRLGFFLLSNHPEVDVDRTALELLKKENYHQGNIQFEFYRLLEQGFQHLSKDDQEKICQVICNGPSDTEQVEQRAEYLAEGSDDPIDAIKQRIIKKWHCSRLYLIEDNLSQKYREYLYDLLDEYGSPERLPTEPLAPESHGGIVKQKEPDELNQIPGDSAEEVLQFLAEWEPPEEEVWERRVEGGFEEVSFQGVCNNLKERIRDYPEDYTAEITLLKDVKPQYADIALNTLQDVLDDGYTFHWGPVLELCEYIAEHPEDWSDRCRYDIATLLYNAIVLDTTDFPMGRFKRTKQLLLNLVAKVEVDPDEQPQSWIGGVGTSQEEARSRAVEALIILAVWQHDDENGSTLDTGIREAIRTKLSSDSDLEVRTSLGRQFGNLWALDEELAKDGLENLFPTGDSLDTKQRFSRAFNGYLSRHGCNGPAYNLMRPYYIHAIRIVTDEEADRDFVNSDGIAGHIGASYIFQDESLDDEGSLIRRYYTQSSPESAAKVANAIYRTLQNGNALDGKWEYISSLWKWRLEQAEQDIESLEEEEKHRREFHRFLDCLKNTDEAGLLEEQELLERSVRFIIHDSFGVRSLEEWLADQSIEYPVEAISVYEQFTEASSPDKWPEIVRSSQDEHREQLYTNAAGHGNSAGKTAVKIANQFAAQGEEYDRNFLDDQLRK
ncbi:ATP-binding protein [Haloferax gibbonsii]|uniref:MalT-like winged helix domain-containing protein n=1 Tax=Haloferax gibbonsii TaxID=35746 RepID=A0A0K1IZI7_HALGI|nr:AAA family ATPase [Haloferax gibbonsii]AKU09859.1 hypothetical protein ABY42_18775 [Haloferax gibbonsii]